MVMSPLERVVWENLGGDWRDAPKGDTAETTTSHAVAMFIAALKNGTAKEFLDAHPELTAKDIRDIRAYLASAETSSELDVAVDKKIQNGSDRISEEMKAEAEKALAQYAESTRGAIAFNEDYPSVRSAYQAYVAQAEGNGGEPVSYEEFKKGYGSEEAPKKGDYVFPSRQESAGGTFTAREGDTWAKIAARSGVDVNALMAANDATDPNEVISGSKYTVPAPTPRREGRGEQTQPTTDSTTPDPNKPGPDNTKPNSTNEYDQLYEQDPGLGLLFQSLIGSKNYTAGYAGLQGQELNRLAFLDALNATMSPGSVSADKGTGARLAEMFGAGQNYDPMALLQQALTDPEYRAAYEPEGGSGVAETVAKLLFGLRSQNLPQEAQAVYQGGNVERLYYDYLQQNQGQANAKTFLQYLVEKGY